MIILKTSEPEMLKYKLSYSNIHVLTVSQINKYNKLKEALVD